jgi:hypothetical protein
LFSLVPWIALRSNYQSPASGDVGFGPPHQGSGNLTLIVKERVSSNEALHLEGRVGGKCLVIKQRKRQTSGLKETDEAQEHCPTNRRKAL